jgi:toxin HigB-1
MIKTIKHKGLRLLFEKGDPSKLPASQRIKIEDILAMLDDAARKEDMDFPGSGFHELKGNLKGHYSVKVTGNYRITFRFEKGNVYDVDYTDYH